MRLITTRSSIKAVPDMWDRQYKNTKNKQHIITGIRLRSLDLETCTPDDIAVIIGNKSWTHLCCDECENDVNAVVELGQEPDYESRTARVCLDCVKNALSLGSAQ